jgi:magnesium-transporting ATPase (P-type)
VAYLETSTLDGEKHLKPRDSPKETQGCVKETVDFGKPTKKKFRRIGSTALDLNLVLRAQTPNPSLYNFQGYLEMVQMPEANNKIPNGDDASLLNARNNQVSPSGSLKHNGANTVPLSAKNFLFKGAKIRNVDWIIGIVVYTGTDTKIQLNSSISASKMSSLEKKLHKMIIFLFVLQLSFSLLTAFGKGVLHLISGFEFSSFFTRLQNTDEDAGTLKTALRYFVLLNTMIPISLMVNIEVIKMFQAWIISENLELKSAQRNM